MCLAFVFKISSTDSEIIAAYNLFWKLFITRTVISPRVNGTSFLDKMYKNIYFKAFISIHERSLAD